MVKGEQNQPKCITIADQAESMKAMAMSGLDPKLLKIKVEFPFMERLIIKKPRSNGVLVIDG